MKKLTILILVLCLVFSLFSCGTKGNGDSSGTPEGSGTGEQNPPEGYTPRWHLSEQLGGNLLSEYDLGVAIPLTECTRYSDDVVFEVELFEKFYPLGSYLQARITVTNNSEADIIYYANSSPGEITSTEYNSSSRRTQSLTPILEPEGYEDINYYIDGVQRRVFKRGEQLVFERAILVSPRYFIVGEYSLEFTIRQIEPTTKEYKCSIPIFFVDRNTTDLPWD